LFLSKKLLELIMRARVSEFHFVKIARIQERVKADVEKYTGLAVEAVHVHVKGVVTSKEADRCPDWFA
jgi:hypothetical protein